MNAPRAKREGRLAGVPHSTVEGLAWPALPDAGAMATLALHEQLMHSQWWRPERIAGLQMQQLRLVLSYAKRNVPLYRRSLPAGGSISREFLAGLPVLTRAQVQEDPAALSGGALPKSHQPVSSVRSSGSTGRPVELKASAITMLFRRALYLREHFWHGRDLTLAAATIRNYRDGSGMPPEGKVSGGWGYGYNTRPIAGLSIRATVDQQLAWLERVNPAYLSTFPTNLRALATEALARGVRLPALRQVSTYAESVPPGLRELARRAFGAELVDIYSSEEAGPIAFQCPQDPQRYHVQSENVIVELVDDAGRPVRPGEAGRVLVTDLHNLATPLIRYEIGDYAEAGPPCACGRGLPVLSRILGRTRSMLRMPGGRLRWPTLPSGDELGRIAPVRQFQLAQLALGTLELRLVTARKLTREEEQRVRAAFLSDLAADFELRIAYPEAIPRSAGGKYEDFRCEMPA